jgi:tetratricopeptide (TPR) repeat protein
VANLRLSRADCLAKLGEGYAKQRAWSDAVFVDERAVQWAPGRQEYLVNLSGALMERARAAAPRDPLQADADAARATELMEEAARADPLNPNHRSNLARLYHKWARIGDPTKRAERFEQADAAYQQALAMWPQNVVLWNERAVLYAARGQVQQMLDSFDHSIRLNDAFAETYVRRAQVFVALGRFDDAVADYRRVRRWGPGYNIGRIVELYQATGQTDRALAEAQAGLTNASAEELPNLRILIRKLEAGAQRQK